MIFTKKVNDSDPQEIELVELAKQFHRASSIIFDKEIKRISAQIQRNELRRNLGENVSRTNGNRIRKNVFRGVGGGSFGRTTHTSVMKLFLGKV